VRGAITIQPCVPAAGMGRFAGGVVNHSAGQGPGRSIRGAILKARVADDLGSRAACCNRERNGCAVRNAATAGVDGDCGSPGCGGAGGRKGQR
jgi:hypothetical protein